MKHTLSESELRHVAMVAVDRRLAAIARNRTQPLGQPKHDLWGLDIASCAAEYTVAKLTHRSWNLNTGEDLIVTPPDVGTNGQVRSSDVVGGHCWIYPKDNIEHVFFFVLTHELPTLDVVGSIRGTDAAETHEWKPTPRGPLAYWVKQDELTPFE